MGNTRRFAHLHFHFLPRPQVWQQRDYPFRCRIFRTLARRAIPLACGQTARLVCNSYSPRRYPRLRPDGAQVVEQTLFRNAVPLRDLCRPARPERLCSPAVQHPHAPLPNRLDPRQSYL